MTFSGRIRFFLVAAAVLPPAIIMFVIYLHFEREIDLADTRRAHECRRKYDTFNNMFQKDLLDRITDLKQSPQLRRTLTDVQSGRTARLDIDPRSFGLDILEVIDSTNTVLATYHRPGLLGQELNLREHYPFEDTIYAIVNVEYDLDGGHAAFVHRVPLNEHVALYTGKYMDDQYLARLALIVDATVKVYMPAESYRERAMEQDSIYFVEETYFMAFEGSPKAGFYLTAEFRGDTNKPTFVTLFSLTGLLAIVATLIAVILGFYITGRAKREINNIVSATGRVAAGDFSTPVMAYEEGEFSQLADSVSDMMLKLRETQQRLATSQKIAAWQTVGRKIAHEVKNPLTPIAISADDLRRSYAEGLPEFDKILKETTGTIKGEVERLIKLLDEFVGFARMSPPVIKDTNAAEFIESISALYRSEIDSGKVTVTNHSKRKTVSLDPEAFKQVLINLIKNGLEAVDDSKVTVTITDDNNDLVVLIEDTGPGFTEEKLANSFEPYSSTKQGGSGLGLVISHRIVHDHGGVMGLFNRTDGGAGIRIRLPQE